MSDVTGRTIEFTALDNENHYSISQLNELFRRVAAIVNNKLDTAVDQEEQRVVIGTTPVIQREGGEVLRDLDRIFVGVSQVKDVVGGRVILDDNTTTEAVGELDFNLLRLRNLKPGEAGGDAITVKQAKEILGVE